MKSLEEMRAAQDAGELTLEEDLELNAMVIGELQGELLAGGIWMPRALGDLSKTFAITDRLLSCLGQAITAHYRLRYWMAQNGYATGLPIRMILQNYTLGGTLLRELIDFLELTVEYAMEWRAATDDAKNAESELADER